MIGNKILIPSTFDPIFKSLVQHNKFRPLLALIINKCTGFPREYVYENLTFINGELPKEKYKEKGKITDVLVNVDDNIINIECNQNMMAIKKNNLYHHKLAYEPYFLNDKINDNAIYQINFNTKLKFDGRIVIAFALRDSEGKYTIEKNFKRIYVNLSNAFNRYKQGKRLTKFEKILVIMMLNNLNEMHLIAGSDKELMDMVKIIEELNEDEKIIGLYDKEKMDKALNEYALKKSEEDGISKGRALGQVEGSNEEKINIAKAMLKKQMDIKDIVELTGLDEEKVLSLKI